MDEVILSRITKEAYEKGYADGKVDGYNLASKAISSQRKKGRFIGTEYDGYADGNPVYYEWKCSCCGAIFEDDEPTYNYCPNCGADMRGEEDDN